jgi:hypothetical protein
MAARGRGHGGSREGLHGSVDRGLSMPSHAHMAQLVDSEVITVCGRVVLGT